jgi:hypothetical protein
MLANLLLPTGITALTCTVGLPASTTAPPRPPSGHLCPITEPNGCAKTTALGGPCTR